MLDTMTLDQLRALEAVAETGSFSAAARKLGRVQSAVSQSIQALETSLGVALFDRSGRTPTLTDTGRVILADALHLLRGAEALKARAATIAEDMEPELTLAVEAMFPVDVLTVCLREFAEMFPLLPVTVYTEAVGGAEQRLVDGSARIALYPPMPAIPLNREAEFLITIPTVPVVAADHPLARAAAPLSRAALEEEVQLVLTARQRRASAY
jgi:DNA-binding transcriptional LysR family regulator